MGSFFLAGGIGLLWGGVILVITRVFGDHGPRRNRFVTGVSNVLLAMAAVYVATSTDVSIFVAGTVALGVLGLGFLTGSLELTA
jgi:hypothetical protein